MLYCRGQEQKHEHEQNSKHKFFNMVCNMTTQIYRETTYEWMGAAVLMKVYLWKRATASLLCRFILSFIRG